MNCVGDAGVRVIGDHARNGAPRLVKHHIGHVPFLGEFNAVGDALLPEGVQNLMADAVGRVGGAANRFLAEILGMSAKTSLCDMAVRGSGEGYALAFQIDDGFGSIFGEQLGRVLVDEPVAALDGVVVMPVPVIMLHIAQCGGDAAFGGAGV